MNSNYETLYGVGLLDDLHNYYPALLYDSSSFQSFRDVLQYVQQQTRNRFDLFSYGLREYVSSHPPRAPSNSLSDFARTLSRSTIPRINPTTLSTLPTPNPATTLMASNPSSAEILEQILLRSASQTRPNNTESSLGRVQTIEVNLTQGTNSGEESDDEAEPHQEQIISNALLSLLNIPTSSLITNRHMRFGPSPMDQFLQPVVVRPTNEQIANNTTVGNLVSDTEHSCAICQDVLSEEQEGRKLNACGHWFHKDCIDTWLARDVHCPVCRHDIREPANATAQ